MRKGAPPPAAEVARRLGGRVLRRDLLRYTSEKAIKRALRSGDLVRAARGLYVVPALPAERTAAAACRGVVSDESAAQVLGLPLLNRPAAVHVTTPRGARPAPMKNVVVHRRELLAREVVDHVTTPLRTVLDCCLSLPFREALALADSAARLVPGFLDEFVAAAARPCPGRARRMLVARHISPLAANPFESAVRAGLISAGISGFAAQVWIETPGGRMRVDLADVTRKIVIEADGFEWHGSRLALADDCRRYDELTRAGWIVLRFAWEHVMFEPDWVISVIQDLIRGADGRRRTA